MTGKANAGKNFTAELLAKQLCQGSETYNCRFMAFADPIKNMAEAAFPNIPKKWLYGSSKYRNKIIPQAFKDGNPLTVRQLLIDLGNEFGRKYNPNIWVDNFNFRFKEYLNTRLNAIMITDVRFRSEFDAVKKLGFYKIRILRNSCSDINDISETNQDEILDSEFDFIIDNNSTKKQLEKQVKKIASILKTIDI